MSTELILSEAVPALAQFELSAEMQKKFEDLVFEMTTPPRGVDPSDWYWRPDVVKIKTPTTTDDSCPGNAEVGDLWASGEILWSRGDDGVKNPWLFIPVYYWKNHSKFIYGQRNPDCSSPDGITSLKGLACNECPHQPWKGATKVRAGSDKTACDETFSFMVMNEDATRIYQLNFRGTSAKAGKNIINNTRRNWWDKMYSLITSEQTGGTNTWQKYESKPISGSAIAPEVAAFAEFICDTCETAHDQRSADLVAKREEINKMLDEDAEDPDAIDALEAELDGDDGFSESM
jgi:hypothetical protein